MQPFSCLAIDMGAGSIRIVQGIFSETLIMKEVYRFENQIERIDGADRWNLKRITEGILYGLTKAIAESDLPVESIGVDSWGVDFVLLGEDGIPLENAVSYRDNRTTGMKEKWDTIMSEKATFRATGINYNIFNSLYQFLSLKGSAVLTKTWRVLFMSDYINYLLTGRAVNELTLSCTSQMMNSSEKDFDPEILDSLGLDRASFSRPVIPGYKLGLTNNTEQFNRAEVIVVGGHDTASAVASIPFTNENFLFISTGTWCIMGMLSEKSLVSEEAYRLGITNEMTVDGKFRPSKNLMGLWLVQQLREAFGGIHSYSDIDQLVEKENPSMYLIDPADEIFYHPQNMEAAFDQYLDIAHQVKLRNAGEYYRCAYDSLVASFKKSLHDFEQLRGKPFECVHLTGGGSQSEILCRLTANAVNLPVIAGPVEGAAIGNLLVQACSLGHFTSFAEGREYIRKSFNTVVYKPEMVG